MASPRDRRPATSARRRREANPLRPVMEKEEHCCTNSWLEKPQLMHVAVM
jgi:hypothetical protein